MQLKANDYETKDIPRIIREWTGLSQKEFAKTLKKSKRTIEAWEYGQTTMNLKTFLKMCKEHNIEVIVRKK